MTPSAAAGILAHAGKLWPYAESGQYQWSAEQWNVVRKAVIRLPDDFYPVAKEALDRLCETTSRVTPQVLCEALAKAHREWAAKRAAEVERERRAEASAVAERGPVPLAERLRQSMDRNRIWVERTRGNGMAAALFERARRDLLDLIARGETEPDPVRDRELGQEVMR